MRVRWTTADDDPAHIVERIREDNPSTAQRVARSIYTAVAGLRKIPCRGRIGLAPNMREPVFTPWPYIAVYEVIEDCVQLLRIRHASRNWP